MDCRGRAVHGPVHNGFNFIVFNKFNLLDGHYDYYGPELQHQAMAHIHGSDTTAYTHRHIKIFYLHKLTTQ